MGRNIGCRAAAAAFIFVVVLLAGAGGPRAAEPELPVLARVGPWPAASRLIVYDGRLWFANSVKGRNHNAADLYSLGLEDGDLRYERGLFSQDAGRPLVHDGLLYWPFEDARWSLGWGHYALTDGRHWCLGTIPSARIFHVHAMAAFGGGLVAATSAWPAGLQKSQDGGTSWRPLYDHPTPERRVSRINELVPWAEDLLLPLWMRDSPGLLRLRDGEVGPVPGWVWHGYPEALAARPGHLAAVVRDGEARALRVIGGALSRDADGPIGAEARDIVAGPEGFWLLSAAGEGGRIWRSTDGIEWTPTHLVKGGRPQELLVAEAGLFVAGAGDDGRGIVWGRVEGPGSKSVRGRACGVPAASEVVDWGREAERLAALLADRSAYAAHGRGLRDAVARLAWLTPPEGFFTDLLSGPMPGDRVSLIGGAVAVPADFLDRWILFWGMALARRGQVPTEYLRQPWAAPSNPSGKYFQPLLAALQAVAAVGQRDQQTIDALIARLSYASDPLWLKGDVVAVLTVLTGRRFAYDVAAWRDWWAEADWPTAP